MTPNKSWPHLQPGDMVLYGYQWYGIYEIDQDGIAWGASDDAEHETEIYPEDIEILERDGKQWDLKKGEWK